MRCDCNWAGPLYCSAVSFEMLKQELSGLQPDQQRELVAYLVSLQDAANTAYRESLARKIDDRDVTHFATLAEMDRRLGAADDDRSS
jgi:hypothetical protein